MASATLSRRVGKVVPYPPLSEMSDPQRREFPEAVLDAKSFEDLPGEMAGGDLKAEEIRPDLRLVDSAAARTLRVTGDASASSAASRGNDRPTARASRREGSEGRLRA